MSSNCITRHCNQRRWHDRVVYQLFPSTACETYTLATNPTDLVAALQATVLAMLELSKTYLDDERRGYYTALVERIPRDVDWKLHAPRNTVVEGRVRGGQLLQLTITPPERAKDVVNMWAKASGSSTTDEQ